MNLARLPFSHFDLLRGEVDRLFDDFVLTTSNRVLSRVIGRDMPFPALNLWDGGDTLFVEAELPGLTIDNLEISTTGKELTVHGKRTEQGNKQCACHRQERGCGEFARILDLPCEIDSNAVEATLQNGVLTIKLPKASSAKPRKIAVCGH